ncbi:MAG: prepilin-type N-terminal cleavage/methylation domain-containing protein [Planctomycetaceae bacterium]|jgi:prepilin-type N-terminal cleavage/methylation domain-containing protein|nr:prepilin-type N-terminal cleavage/methylation domain-containing protein [Planctomycetaceae bacterium]
MKTTIKFKGFTLIELLIVIGLLAALASVLLPSLMGDREAALEGVCSYNQAGTLRTLRQYQAITNQLPPGFHTGLKTNAATLTDNLMSVPEALSININTGTSAEQLTASEANGLNKLGIVKVVYGEGKLDDNDTSNDIVYTDVAAGIHVLTVNENWRSDEDPFSFNSKSVVKLWEEGFTKIIPLFLTPTVDWKAHEAKGWVKGFSVKMEIPGTCPIPENTDFAYYVAYVGLRAKGWKITKSITTTDTTDAPLPAPTIPDFIEVTGTHNAATDLTETALGITGWTYTAGGTSATITHGYGDATIAFTFTKYDGGEAELLGTSCPECGITNP